MKKGIISKLVIPHGLFTPRGLMLRAVFFLGFFLILHAAGWRDATMVLSGTTPIGLSGDEAAIRGILYILTHLGTTVVAPIFVLAAGILAWTNRCVAIKEKGDV
jgi:hypothetical protein